MPPKKPPTSELSGSHVAYFSSPLLIMIAPAIEFLVMRIWYQTLAIIWVAYSGGASPVTPPIRSPRNTKLPLEIVEMITAYLAYDIRSLRACTMTCCTWYIAAAPHLHSTLTICTNPWYEKFRWPAHLWPMNDYGLLPLVKKFRIRGSYNHNVTLSPMLLGWYILLPFLSFTSLQELEIAHLDTPSFIPAIRWIERYTLPTARFLALGEEPKEYRQHICILPALRSLILREPKGSCRQIVYFIGLFQHLEDLKLIDVTVESDQADDSMLVPLFAPPLRGRLTAEHLRRVDLLKDMIDLFGGIRFRYMRLLDVRDGMELLLDACAKTMESVVLDPIDFRGERLFPKGMKFSPTISQLDPLHRTLVYHSSSHFGRSRSRRRLSMPHIHALSSSTYSQSSNPLRPSRSPSIIKTTSPVHDPRCIMNDPKCYARCVQWGTFGWFCMQQVIALTKRKRGWKKL